MSVWVIRAGRSGEFEDFFLEEGIAVINFSFPRSVANFTDKRRLLNSLQDEPAYKDSSNQKIGNAGGQLWRFANDIQNGDMVVMPRKSPRAIAVGAISSDYSFQPDLPNLHTGLPDLGRHTRNVKWWAVDVPRDRLDKDLLNSLGGLATVYRVRAENAEYRVNRVANAYLGNESITEPEDGIYIPDDDTPESNLDEQIEDRIVQRIRQKFFGTRLEYLVAEILGASGYHAVQTRLGPDGGIDVVAGMGEMGFGEPRLCVQVKSGNSPVGLPDYDRLRGNIQNFGAQYGLLVSLSDFTSVVRKENERSFFEIRLWGPHELVENLLATYDSLPAEIRADVPLQNRRVLVESEE